ncbi:YSC84-related protein [Pseudoxanthomonas sp. UTMC 1351]|uniref:lipid-binding SYLF domain-containing protein n=1 Tax=Pseudoxanthomonas sp. UTMC 1351 TaxID=2695853 RepID=UPI0034CDF0A1
MPRAKHIAMPLAFICFAFLAGCSTSNVRDPVPGENPSAPLDEARNEVRTMARNTLQQLYASQPAAKQTVESAAGYAVFSNFGMKILVAGGGTGEGLAVNNAKRQEIFMRMAEVQAGLGFGVKKFRLVWVFETQSAFDAFVNQGYQFGSQATLGAQASGKGVSYAGAMSVSPGVWVYQITDDGLAAELTVKGTKYYRDNNLN